MEGQLDLPSLAPKAPGYILAPTTFLLEGEPDDFIDWDEATGSAEDDHWADDPSYWLLVFRVRPEKEGKWVQLDAEICVDMLGRLRCVPLSKHWDKDVRPVSAQSASTLMHAWGWRYPDSNKNPHDLYVHWILASPFQLGWASLPPMDAKDRTCSRNEFDKWADRRGLQHTFVTSEELARGKVVVSVPSSWREGFARNRALCRAIAQSQPTPQQRKERFLYDLVNLTLHRNSMVLPHLKKAEFDAFSDKIAAQERQANDRVVKESVRFDSYLKSKSYAALKRDAENSRDPSAVNKLLVIFSRVFCGITEAPVILPGIRERGAEIMGYLQKHYDSKSAFRDVRRAAKSYWYLVKTFLDATDIKAGVPEWLVGACQSFAQKWYGRDLPYGPAPRAAAMQFEKAAVADIKSRSTASVAHLRFFALLEVVNVGVAIADLSKARSGTEREKKGIALIGSTCSLISGSVDLWKAVDKNLAKTWGGKYIAHKLTTKVLGAASSSVDIVTGAWAVATDLETHDEKAVAFHGAQALGGAISLVGYIMIATGVGAPVGALFVFLGSALGLGGSVGVSMFKSSDIENWVKYCRWGILAGKEGVGDEPTSWAEGPPRELHLQVNKQIRTLNALLIGLEVEVSMVYDPGHPEVEVTVHANMIADDGVIYLELTIEGLKMRKLSPWKRGKDRGPDGTFRERFSLGDAANVTVRVRTNPFGDGQLWHPQEPLKKSVTLVAPKGTLANPFVERPY